MVGMRLSAMLVNFAQWMDCLGIASKKETGLQCRKGVAMQAMLTVFQETVSLRLMI